MTTPPIQPQRLLALCGGNQAAFALIHDLWDLVEVWDDLIDKDKPVPDGRLNRAILFALAGRDENPFLAQHPELMLALKQMVALWLAANALESSKRVDALRLSYVLRCSPYFFFVSVIVAANGVQAGAEAALELFADPDEDSFDAYVQEHTHGMEEQAPAA